MTICTKNGIYSFNEWCYVMYEDWKKRKKITLVNIDAAKN